MRGRPKAQLVLSDAEREQLVEWTRRRKTSQALALRARIVLACADGVDNKVVAARQRVTQQTVGKWRRRFVEHRLDGLLDAPRPGAPRTIDDARIEEVIAMTLESHARRMRRTGARALMAKDTGLYADGRRRIWRAFGLQPHRQETFKLSTDPLFIDKVRDIVGLYLNPPRSDGAVCRREEPDPSARSHATDAAAGSGRRRAAHSRLHAPRHDHAVCGAGFCHR